MKNSSLGFLEIIGSVGVNGAATGVLVTTGGVTGFGASFVVRDPAGIRPAYYWANDEVVIVASEKTAIKAAFNANFIQATIL